MTNCFIFHMVYHVYMADVRMKARLVQKKRQNTDDAVQQNNHEHCCALDGSAPLFTVHTPPV